MPLIIGEGEERDPASLALETCLRRRIPNSRRLPKKPEIMKAAHTMLRGSHQSLKLRSLSSEYNCVGLVFGSRRTWIDPKHIPMILEDDGYRVIPAPKVVPGDLLVYTSPDGEITHIAVIIEHAPRVANATWITRVLSQWGQDGEYFHNSDDVSYHLGKPQAFWTERRT